MIQHDPPSPPAAPLSWQCGYADGPGGRTCTVQIRQAAQAYMLTLVPDDMAKLGQSLLDAAQQARTGLVVATAVPSNGQPPRG
jgi:hypothetical protein